MHCYYTRVRNELGAWERRTHVLTCRPTAAFRLARKCAHAQASTTISTYEFWMVACGTSLRENGTEEL